MKNNVLKLLGMLSKYAIIGCLAQCIAFSFLMASEGNAQKSRSVYDVEIALEQSSVPTAALLDFIEAKTDFVFAYDKKDFTFNKNIQLKSQKLKVSDILMTISKKERIGFKQINNNIFIRKLSSKEANQNKLSIELEMVAISGTVTSDEDGSGLPGVNVIVKGTSTGTVTDVDGSYKLEVPTVNNPTLVFSFVGFYSKEIAVNNQTVIDVSLEPNVESLEEIVVVGYTSQKKATITGSIATITTKDLQQSPTANLNNALAGRMPGLMVNQFSGGEPGVDRSDVYVRGFGTYGDKSPIVIIDGVERSMDYLSPNEIETFTILKDASATAPFGVRGANGVIVITTKRGEIKEKASVNFKASVGVNEPVKFPKYLGSADYAMLYNEAVRNDNPTTDPSTLNLFSEEAIADFRKAKGDNSDGLGYNWDYFDYAFKPGIQQDYSLSINGGSERARYFVMANYFQQDGNYTNTDLGQYDTQAIFKRYNFRSNIDIDITKNFYAKLDLGARITDRNAPGTTASRVVEFANTQPSYLPIIVEQNDNPANDVYEVNNPQGMLFGDQFYRFNILGELNRTGFINEKNTYFNGSFSLGHNLDFITEGLKIEGLFSYDASEGRWIRRDVGTYSEGYREYPSYATFVPEEGSSIYMTPGHYTGVYKTGNKYDIDQTIGNGIDRNATIGRTYVQLKLEYDRSFDNHMFTGMILGNRSKRDVNNEVAYSYQGMTSRLTYNYDDRYLLEFNAGLNGSENFAPGQRYGFFPAVSAGWVLSNENFLNHNNISWLDNLKIRGSYGLVGSDKVPNDKRFIYLQYFSGGSDYYFGTNNFGSKASDGISEGDLANPNLTWEKARKTNIGIDALLFNQRLSITADLFYEHRYDIITDLGGGDKLGFPDVVGKNAPYINSGIVNNKGIDFEIGWNGQIGNNFFYYIKPNFTFARNEIIFMNEIQYDNPWRGKTGKRIDENLVYMFDHFVRNQEEADALNAMNQGAGFQPWGQVSPGDVVYKDLDGDGRIDDLGDRTPMGHPRTPEVMFGIPIGFQLRDFDFSVMLQGATNTSVMLNGAAVWDFPRFAEDKYGKVKPMHLNRWTPETAETATYPALHYADNTNNKNDNSSLFLYDASYVRLKTIEIGYHLPKKVLSLANLQQVRFYAQGLNLFTLDGLDEVDVDPETKNGSGAWYPIQRVINFGVDVRF